MFTVKSAYRLAADEQQNTLIASTSSRFDGSCDGWNAVWSSPAPPKVLNFAWRLATNCLPTWCNKQERNLEVVATCPVCGCADEDTFHAFCSCINARRLWHAMAAVWDLPEISSTLPSGEEWFIQLAGSLEESTRVGLMMLLWRMWYVRNEIIHAKPAPPMEVSCRFLASYLESLQSIAIDPNVDMHSGKIPISTCYPLMVDTCNNNTPLGNPWFPHRLGMLNLTPMGQS